MLAYPRLGDQVRNGECKRTSSQFFPLFLGLIYQHLMGCGITCCQKPPSACSNELIVRELSRIVNQKTTVN